MEPQLIDLLPSILPAVGLYAAIRADLAANRVKAEQAAHDAHKAHERIDDHINLHHVK